jgi:hypothetical protein
LGVVARPVVVAAWVTASTSTSLAVLEEIKVFRQIIAILFEKFVVATVRSAAASTTTTTTTSLAVLKEIKVFRQITTLFEFEKFVVVPTATLVVLEKIKVFVFGVKACVGGIVVFVVFRVNKCLGVEAEIVLLGHDDRGRVENEKRR